MSKIIYCPFASGVRFVPTGNLPLSVELALDTREACRRTKLCVLEDKRRDDRINYAVVLCAGNSKKYGVNVSQLMKDEIDQCFLRERLVLAGKCDHRAGLTSDIRALVAHIKRDPEVEEVVLICRDFESLRMRIVFDAYLELFSIRRRLRIRIEDFKSDAPFETIMKEFWWCTPCTMVKILIGQPRVFLRLASCALLKIVEGWHGRKFIKKIRRQKRRCK